MTTTTTTTTPRTTLVAIGDPFTGPKKTKKMKQPTERYGRSRKTDMSVAYLMGSVQTHFAKSDRRR